MPTWLFDEQSPGTFAFRQSHHEAVEDPRGSVAAIAEWAADAPQPVRAALGARRDGPNHWAVPAETTIRRTLGRLDPDALTTAIGAWLADRNHHGPGRRRALAVDGKTLRGARCAADGRQVHLLAAMDHTSRAVLAQRQVAGAHEEVPAFQPLLAPLDLARTVITADALQTHPEAAEFLITGSTPTTCSRSRPTSRPCWPAASASHGTASPSWTAPVTAATAASRSALSRPSRSTSSGSPTPPKSSRSPARPATCATIPGGSRP